MNMFDIDYDIDPALELNNSTKPPTILATLPKELSERIPAEIWRLVAFHTVSQYDIRVTDSTFEQSAIQLVSDNFQELKNTQLVSRTFDAGIRSGFRDGFSGSMAVDKYWPVIPIFVNTTLSHNLRWLNLRHDCLGFYPKDLRELPFKALNEALLSKRYPNLKSITFTSFMLYDLDLQECLDGEHDDDILEETEYTKNEVVSLGLRGIDEMKSCPVRVNVRVGGSSRVFVEVEIREQLKISRYGRCPRVAKTLEQMSIPQFIRLAAGSEQEARETLNLSKLQQAQFSADVQEIKRREEELTCEGLGSD